MGQQDKDHATETDFHSAAIIDQQGREVPITEDMIKKACEKLEQEQQQQTG